MDSHVGPKKKWKNIIGIGNFLTVALIHPFGSNKWKKTQENFI
jgi:hypothetical protein